MAYDGYRTRGSSSYDQIVGNMSHSTESSKDPRSAPFAPPYPSRDPPYASDHISMPQPPMPSTSPTSSINSEPYPDGTRHFVPRPGSINDAVNSAFNKAETSAYLSPEVLSQITANVIQQLKASGLGQPQTQNPLEPQAPQQASWHQASYNPPMTPRSTVAPPESNHGPSNAEHSRPLSPGRYANEQSRWSRKSSPASAGERSQSLSSKASEHSHRETRPIALSRDSTVKELTTLEKIWGKLFDNGKPTERLGQFLRGIAVHLIEHYPKKNSLVVVPDKMQRFYKETHVKSDPYPWQDIFDHHTSSISRLYREVEVEHHLVQDKLNERPDIPGLTPSGFQRWVTLMILAHPDREYERLQKAVLHMPISNPDDKKERFPKEIPRRLFPQAPDLSLREKLDRHLIQHCVVEVPPITEEERIRAGQQSSHYTSDKAISAQSTSSTEAPSSSCPDRGRQPYSVSASAIIDDDDDDPAPPRPIERERKPYTAQPGGGKVYDEPNTSKRAKHESFSSNNRPKVDPPSTSTATSVRHQSDRYSQEAQFGHGSPVTGSYHPPNTRRRSRSSSLSVNVPMDYRRSESDLVDNESAARYVALSSTGKYYSSTAGTIHPGDIAGESRRYHDVERDHDSDCDSLYETFHGRDRDRDKGKYHDRLPSRGAWQSEEEYYRSSGAGGGSVSNDYKTYSYR